MEKARPCLFCKQSTLLSRSVEHIIPEAFGSKIKVLPAGIVCDSCNQYFAIKVEKPILEHPSFRNIRAYNQIPGKKGRIPSLLGIMQDIGIMVSLRVGKNGEPEVQPENEHDRQVFEACFSNRVNSNDFAPLFFPVGITPPKEAMSRLLAKMGLEAMAYLNVQDHKWLDSLTHDPHYDLIRNYARYGSGVKQWPYLQRRIFPEDTQMRHPSSGEWVQVGFGHDLFLTDLPETYFLFIMYGVEFAFNIGGPSVSGYEKWIESNNNSSPIFNNMEVTLVSRQVNGKQTFYLE